METCTVTEAKARLNELVDEVESTHEQIMITKHGHPSVVLISAEELDSLRETLYWLSQPRLLDELRASAAGEDSGAYLTEDEVRRKYAAPRVRTR
jgi:prevent-host-death family protein